VFLSVTGARIADRGEDIEQATPDETQESR
jgi:hypothetical protein